MDVYKILIARSWDTPFARIAYLFDAGLPLYDGRLRYFVAMYSHLSIP